MNQFVWTMARFWIRLRSGRNPPRCLPDPVWIVRAAARERGLPAEYIAFLEGIEPREESKRGAA